MVLLLNKKKTYCFSCLLLNNLTFLFIKYSVFFKSLCTQTVFLQMTGFNCEKERKKKFVFCSMLFFLLFVCECCIFRQKINFVKGKTRLFLRGDEGSMCLFLHWFFYRMSLVSKLCWFSDELNICFNVLTKNFVCSLDAFLKSFCRNVT